MKKSIIPVFILLIVCFHSTNTLASQVPGSFLGAFLPLFLLLLVVFILFLVIYKINRKGIAIMSGLFSFEDRIGRAQYLLQSLVIGFLVGIIEGTIGIGIGLCSSIIGQWAGFNIGQWAGINYVIICFVFAFPAVKRLHDLGRPGRHYLLFLIPLYNIYLGLVLLFKKGQIGPNEYGSNPLEAKGQVGGSVSKGLGYFKGKASKERFQNRGNAVKFEKKPDYKHWLETGLIKYKSGNFKEAIHAFGNVVDLNPNHALSYFNRAAAYVKLGKKESAINDLKVAAKLGHIKAQETLNRKRISWGNENVLDKPISDKVNYSTLKTKGYLMNVYQKIVCYLTSSLLIFMLIFPPFHLVLKSGAKRNMGYSFIANPPFTTGYTFLSAAGTPTTQKYPASINLELLLVQFLVVVAVGAICWFAFRSGNK